MAPVSGTVPADACTVETSRPALGSSTPQQWAVVTLDDGSQVRMRSLGDRVEIRTWDATESCRPPRLEIERIGSHVIDARVVARTPDQDD